MLKPKDIASRLNVSVRTLQRWDNEGFRENTNAFRKKIKTKERLLGKISKNN